MVKTKDEDEEALQWGAAIGLLVGLLTGLVFFIREVSWGLGGIIGALLIGMITGGIAGYVVGWLVYAGVSTRNSFRRGMRQVREAQETAAKKQAAAAKQKAQEIVRTEKAQRVQALGSRYASILEATLASVRHDIVGSEAARAGLLGDVDFDADIRGVTDNLRKAHELQKVADRLAALDKPGSDDRKLLAEANTTVAKLETAALNRVELIAQCATEAQLVDKSLHDERQDAQTSAQRAELHAKLSAMLYGIEATPDTTPTDSAADAVLVRVRAYREIKNQIQLTRDE
jgi:gas vesicle protein